MQYEDFRETFTNEMIVSMQDSGIDVIPEEVTKVNQTLDALSFHPDGKGMGVLLYLSDFYEQHENGRSMGDLVEDARQIMTQRMREFPRLPQIDHDYIAENLYLTVVNADMNRDYLSGIPHEILEDMAVVPRVRIGEEASFAVKNEMLARYGFSKEGILQIAHNNMEAQEFTCNALGAVLMGYGIPSPEPVSPSENVYVLTSLSGIEGAAAILSDKAMHEARNMIGEDFLILPSSRHEVLLVPRSSQMSIQELTDIVQEVNRTVLDTKDLLSDHVYRYNSRMGSIKMLEPKADVPEKKPSLSPILM
ncbi:MAG: hypothetical protein IJH60_05705 [Eubacterium sp.]|nr:hypothetical protein [Eubacterium sp.]